MNSFKPYINLIRYPDTGIYVLNSVVKIPASYSVVDQSQEQINDDWVVTLYVREFTDMQLAMGTDSIKEFSIELTTPDMGVINKIILQLKDFEARNGESKGSTSGDPGDADDPDEPS
jgi:hypothetical protein